MGLNLIVKPTFVTSSNTSICSSLLPFAWGGQMIQAAGTYTNTFISTTGCDSVVTFISTTGCDSVVTLNLSVTDSTCNSSTSFNCNPDTTVDLCLNPCITLKAKIQDIRASTSDYVINPISANGGCYAPNVNPDNIGPSANLMLDDTYSSVIPLPFSFPFYDDPQSPYNSLIIATNGFLSFDVSKAGAYAHYNMTSGNIPNTFYDKSLIMGVFHDINPFYTTSPNQQIKYEVVGVSPNRKFVVSYYMVPLFSTTCQNAIENIHQTVLHEGTGIIEVFVKSIEQCPTWNRNRKMIGLQNFNKNKGIMPPGRSALDSGWGSLNMNEAWRFVPSAGPSLFRSVKLYDLNGNFVANGDTTGNNSNSELDVSFPNVCSSESKTYVIKSQYESITAPGSFVYLYDTMRVIALNDNCITFCDSVGIVSNDTTICRGASLTLSTGETITSGFVRDIDGNTYPTINIGPQTWTQKNLNASKYRNGDIIPQVTSAAQWSSISSGAWCWYNNDSASYASTYGKLYNWFAVNDSRGIAPSGWHVPTDQDFLELTYSILGGPSTAGGKMKESGTAHWNSPNFGATNSSGFTGLPGGDRNYFGNFDGNLGNAGAWWSSTESSPNSTFAWQRTLRNETNAVTYSGFGKRTGLSLRLVRNPFSYLWSNGATTSSINVLPTQTTTYYCTISNGVSSCTDSVTITVNNCNTFCDSVGIINNDTTICRGNTLTLSAGETINTGNSGLVSDIDGNVYPTVNIGPQTWLQKNLTVSRYRNGDIIPQVTDPTQWSNLTTGAWCWYNNDSATYGATYGKLYNWYAVNDSRGLAPDGSRVASESDYKKLAKYIDINADTNMLYNTLSPIAGGAMKEIGNVHWNAPNTGATNSTGFAALPGGFRYSHGAFHYLALTEFGDHGIWWTSSASNQSLSIAKQISIYSFSAELGRNNCCDSTKSAGLSVRAILNNNNISYLWSTGDTTSTINVSPTQTTTYYCTISNGLSSCIDSVTVSILDTSINYLGASGFCVGASTTLQAANASSYQWLFNGSVILDATSQSYNATQSGNYSVIVTNSIGCIDTSRSLLVSLYPIPNSNFTVNNTSACLAGNNFIFTNSSSVSSGTLSYF